MPRWERHSERMRAIFCHSDRAAVFVVIIGEAHICVYVCFIQCLEEMIVLRHEFDIVSKQRQQKVH